MTPEHGPPTRVLRSTARQPPPPPAAPAPPAHFWRQRVPAHIGRARTSTLVLGLLFVVFAALYVLVRPAPVEYTTVETTSGQTVRVPVSELDPTTEPPSPAPPTSEAPTPTETSAPESPEETTAPTSTPTVTEDEETGEPTTSSRAPTTTRSTDANRAPATSQASETAPEPEETTGPTG